MFPSVSKRSRTASDPCSLLLPVGFIHLISAVGGRAGPARTPALRRLYRLPGKPNARISAITRTQDVPLSNDGTLAHGSVKAAVDALTIGLAKELASDQIGVNAVAPEQFAQPSTGGAGDPGRPDRVAEKIPLGRAGEPDEVSPAIAWLLGSEAAYVTGAVIRVAGGI